LPVNARFDEVTEDVFDEITIEPSEEKIAISFTLQQN
jgi:hypothetical protein